MDISTIRTERSVMEDSIQTAVRNAIEEFHKKTGLYPCGIDIRIVSVNELASAETRFIVDSVKADISI